LFEGREWFLRKTVPVLALVVVSLLVVVGAAYYLTSRDTSECSDPDSMSSHIYNPDRLDVIKSCTTASGFVDNVLKEAAGDYHIRLALDSQYGSRTTAASEQYQYGDLVVEIICALPITQPAAVSAAQHQQPFSRHSL